MVIAQRESTALFPDMPIAAIDVGKVDLTLPADRIADALIALTDQYTTDRSPVPPT